MRANESRLLIQQPNGEERRRTIFKSICVGIRIGYQSFSFICNLMNIINKIQIQLAEAFSPQKMISEPSSQSQELFEPKHLKSRQRMYHRWTVEENHRYVTFLEAAKEDFEQEYTRRIRKVFKRLSEFMGTKTESQCKSHHQKMVKQHKTIQNVIRQMSKKVEAERGSRRKEEKELARFNSECTRRIRKIFKKLAHFMTSTDPQKTLRQQVCILRVFTELSKAIQIQATSEGGQPDLQLMEEMGLRRYSERVEDYLNGCMLEEDIFNVIDF